MIAIVDYGMGNLRSAQKGFEFVGHDAIITEDTAVIDQADAVVLPGVGAFKDCYQGLCERGLTDVVKAAAASEKPFLGICVGFQLLFEYSEEGEGSEGLAIFGGRVVRFPDAMKTRLKVPHMGWNPLARVPGKDCSLLQETSESPFVYFVHSYYAEPADERIIMATADYGVTFPAIVGKDNVLACQFHPEKSQKEGLAMLKAFGDLVAQTV